MWKKILGIIRKPFLFIIFIVFGIIAFVVAGTTNVCMYKRYDGIFVGSDVVIYSINYMDVTDDRKVVINETLNNTDGYICRAGLDSRKAEYMVDRDLLGNICGTLSRYDVMSDESGKVWLHCVQWSENQSAIDAEGIVEILPGGKAVLLVNALDYGEDCDPPTKTPRLCAFAEKNGVIRFARPDMFGVTFYSIDSNGGERTVTGEFAPDDGTFAVSVYALEDDFLVVMSDGAVYRVGADGRRAEEPLYRCTSSIDDADGCDYITCAAEYDGVIYVAAGYRSDILYRIENGELVPLADINSLMDNKDIEMYKFGVKIKQIIPADGTLFLNIGCDIVTYDQNGLNETDFSFEMPFINGFMSNLPFIGILLLSIGAALLIAFLIVSRKSIILKQLLLTLPVMTVICIFICRRAGTQIIDMYILQQAVNASAICDISSRLYDGDRLKELIAVNEWSDEDYYFIRYELNRILHFNRGQWNALFDLRVCVPDKNGNAMIIVDSRGISRPFTNVDYMFNFNSIDEFMYDTVSEIRLFDFSSQPNKKNNLIFPPNTIDTMFAVAPIYDSELETVAYLVAVTDEFYLKSMQNQVVATLLESIVPYMIILLVLTGFISVIVSIKIRKATRTVSRIADGDLTARIKNKSKDELGEICRQVNTMAENLENIFDEKDKNEQFYYKFVPEKFRELLGKEKITDLALGDAESQEFSVLFCDIRSFSINSEMLTAKENFEFVNVIFGIAGPIIREYNGFVDKYIGDAVMALFETPDNALQAGIKIYRSVVLDPSVAERLNVRDINIGVGIHTGIARIGIVGEEERLSGTVISDTVNLSSRLESLTKTYHTAMIVSKDTVDRMKDPDSLNKRYIGMVQVAGVNDVTALYEILDCLGDEEKERRTANKEDFREAVRLFHLGRRKEAVDVLKEIQKAGKADHVVDMYCEYIENMSDEDKANVFRFMKK